MSAVARRLRVSWDALDGIQRRAVARRLARREAETMARLGADETSFQRRHEYVTVVNDLDRGRVVHVADGRGQDALEDFYRALSPAQLEAVIADAKARSFAAAPR